MTRLSSFLAPTLATLLLAGSGYVHGKWTGRWQDGDPAAEAASGLDRLPMVIGQWQATAGEISEAEQKLAELSGYLLRHYRNRSTGQQVTVLLMCGPSGPVAVHPPTACYSGAGYQQIGAQTKHAVTIDADKDAASRHVFDVAEFALPKQLSATHPQIFWAWSTDGTWSVPDNPRLAFGGTPVLYKLYVTWETPGRLQTDDEPSPVLFLPELIPALQQSVFKSNAS